MKIMYVGSRQRDFTTVGPVTGFPYYVQPQTAIVVDDADGKALIEQDSERWQAVPVSKSKGDK